MARSTEGWKEWGAVVFRDDGGDTEEIEDLLGSVLE
jgi:hypothetical protein